AGAQVGPPPAHERRREVEVVALRREPLDEVVLASRVVSDLVGRGHGAGSGPLTTADAGPTFTAPPGALADVAPTPATGGPSVCATKVILARFRSRRLQGSDSLRVRSCQPRRGRNVDLD